MSEQPSQRRRRLKSAPLIEQQQGLIDAQIGLINLQAEQLRELSSIVKANAAELVRQGAELHRLAVEGHSRADPAWLVLQSPHFRRNFLPNDDSIAQKQLVATWHAAAVQLLNYRELLASGFRVFSQNDEDGVLLRIFTHIGTTNQYVIEIGSNCSDSDLGIPENLSANLIVNHGWHGALFEMDPVECDRTRYFFARDFATKHFHVTLDGAPTYLSPLIIQGAITPANIDERLRLASAEPEPDLMIIDIDGGDYAVIEAMTAIRPRVLVVEFEKRFRDRYQVVQSDTAQFSQRWPQSGAASLAAWVRLLGTRGYGLCAIATCGYNAFFVRNDVADGRLAALTTADAFDHHPILSQADERVWVTPDETWQPV